jgi:hypothetical protein
MYAKSYILFLFILVVSGYEATAQTRPAEHPGRSARLSYTVNGNDTTYLAFLRDLNVYPELKFRNRQQEQFYWRTVRDVKRALPYAKIVSQELMRVNSLLHTIEGDRERRRFLAKYEREVFKKYEKDLRKLTINQGRLLLKLIDRETNSTSYDLIKNYRGNVSAVFWQGMARLFGSNLKSEYDAQGNDKIVERVIVLVESGQL